MKKKQIEIIPPDGYEIDKEKSTSECIRFKPINKVCLTYSDVAHTIMNESNLRYIDSFGNIIKDNTLGMSFPNSAPSEEQLQKVLAINQLFNIAKYYNGNWEPDRLSDYTACFVIWKIKDEYKAIGVYCHTSYGMPEFKNRKVAQDVIDNPNFKDILDTIFK